ncbi:MAG: replication initiator protein WhiP [Desulfurococcales archaeon]|nr:replication initiator protein WhiP [Desulfurococcales archaeon]
MRETDPLISLITEELKKKSKEHRGGPRSKVVEAALVLLLARPMKAAEIASNLGLETKYVSSYLSYWKTRGLLEYSSGLWYLTPKGEELAKEIVERALASRVNEYIAIAKQLIGEKVVSQTRKDKRMPKKDLDTDKLLSFIVNETNKEHNKQQNKRSRKPSHGKCLKQIIDDFRDLLSEEEIEILETLLFHYAKWGSTYMYVDQIQELLQADSHYLMKLLRKLQSKNVIYLYTDPKLGIRVGLSRKMKDLIADVCED